MLDTFCEMTEARLPRNARQSSAYIMIGSIEAVRRELADVGYNPR